MKKIIYITTLLVLIVIFAVSTFFIVINQIENKKQEKIFDDVVSVVEAESNSGNEKLNRYLKLKTQNADFIGWITIDGTSINYPVMKSKTPNYYLQKNFNKEYSYYGTPYVSDNCNLATSDNLIIYGHNMKNHQMFGDLEKYKSKDFYSNHKYIQFDTLESSSFYEIVSVIKTTVNEFNYQNYIDFANEEQFNTFMEECKSLSIYDTETNSSYGDRLITLSTCEYSQKDGRLIIIASKVR